ncbi:response regulator [Algoriphagus sp.]|uniref:response regulator n=1 Tax=Algoriphagus sp. TaxID=1872435 RepID=UPI00326E5190
MKKLLLIDDDEDDQFLFKMAIKSLFPTFSCDVSHDGSHALALLKEGKDLPDLIFVDLNMPIMNGFDFLVHIKKEQQLNKIPIGVFTTSINARDQERTMQQGASFFLTKPSDFQVLCDKLRDVILMNS